MKKGLVKVDGQDNMYRDVRTGAVLFDNSAAIQQGRLIKEKKRLEKQRLDELENDVKEIKELLKQLISKGSE